MPNPSKALKGLSGVAGTAVTEGRAAIRELLNIIKEGAKKDPSQIFLQERQTSHWVPTPYKVKPPEGFEFGKSITMRRSKSMRELHRNQTAFKRHVKDYDASTAAVEAPTPAAKGLQDALDTAMQTKPFPGHATQKPILRQPRVRKGSYKYDPSIRRAVEQDKKQNGLTTAQIIQKYPNVNKETLYSWITGG